MKRTPLKRKTPLQRTGTLKQGAPLKRTKGVRKVSAKTAQRNKQYALQRDVWLGVHDRCEVEGCTNESMHVHHRRGRTGTNMLDESTWLACCNDCHEFIHRYPEWAYERGYLLSRHTKASNE